MDLVFDLDGTLLDVSRRHHAVYRDILEESRRQPLELARYWSLKRAKTPLESILAESDAGDLAATFHRRWLERIERPDYLEMDAIIEGGRRIVEDLTGENRLILVTLRQSAPALETQLRSLSLRGYFQAVIVAERADANGAFKAGLIRDREPGVSGWCVGDTEADVDAARILGLPCCAVTWGLRTHAFLKALGPAALIDSVTALPGVLRA